MFTKKKKTNNKHCKSNWIPNILSQSVRIQLMFKTHLSYLSQILNWWPQNNKIFLSFKSQSLCKLQTIRHYKLSTSILILYNNFNILKYLKKYISRTNNK